MSSPRQSSRLQIVIVGAAEQALRRLGDWRAIEAQAEVTIYPSL